MRHAKDLLHWRVKDALPVGLSAHTARMVSAIDGALGGVMARALLLSVQSPPLNATDPPQRTQYNDRRAFSHSGRVSRSVVIKREAVAQKDRLCRTC